MRKPLILGVILLVGVGAVTSASNADTIEYSTSGYFGTPGTTSVSAGGESLSYTGVTNVFVNTPSTVSFGDFLPTFGAAGTSGQFTGDVFTLILTETDNGTQSSKAVNGTLSGGLSVSSSGANSSNVFVAFTGNAVFTEANGHIATYTPYSTPVGTLSTTVQGNIDAAPTPVTPLPKSALSGAALLGLIGFRQFSRRSLPV